MFDDKMLDGMSFSDLNRGLELILERMDEIRDETGDDEEDPRWDRLNEVANRVIRRMDQIVREHAGHDSAALAQWNAQMRAYEAGYDNYSDIILQDDTLVDFESPEDS